MKIRHFFSLILNHLNGNFAYQNYLTRHQKNHPQKQALDKKSFLKDKARNKKINRCC